MASFLLPTGPPPNVSANTTPHNLSSCHNTITSTQFLLNQKLRKHTLSQTLSCRAAKDTDGQEDGNSTSKTGGKFDRRDILLGLGGLYGTTAVTGGAFAAPVIATDCGKTNLDNMPFCCPEPPASPIPLPLPGPGPGPEASISEYKFPRNGPLRVRPAAHLLDDRYLAKFETAMQIMRNLPDEDPHSFHQQAAIHCAYCDYAYEMLGFPGQKLDVHFSWLFFPFHRWYLYFYEKILGKLIGDPTFALPFWNWDAPPGMQIPAIFDDPNSPLYDQLRDQSHRPPVILDLNYPRKEGEPTPIGDALIKSNLITMYRQMLPNSKTAELFFGKPYYGGDACTANAGMGSIENIPHTNIHRWTGDPTQPFGEDMGRFFSAGRDPIFYSHHANVDRMWNIWKTLPGGKRKDFTDCDWLESAFLLYDENKKLVRVKIRDCLDSKRMGYIYQEVPIPWLRSRPPPKHKKEKKSKAEVANAAEIIPDANGVFPKVLDGLVKVNVPRPIKSRSLAEKENGEEILEIEGIEYDGDEYIKFDVYINDEDEVQSGPDNAEFAGSFSNVPSKINTKVKTSLSLGISDLLDDLGADDDDGVTVAIVPITGKVTIGGLKIKISSY